MACRSSGAVPEREYADGVNLTIDLDLEEDGRWIGSSFATRLKQNPLSVWKLDSNL
jgi:hypothetical protein